MACSWDCPPERVIVSWGLSLLGGMQWGLSPNGNDGTVPQWWHECLCFRLLRPSRDLQELGMMIAVKPVI